MEFGTQQVTAGDLVLVHESGPYQREKNLLTVGFAKPERATRSDSLAPFAPAFPKRRSKAAARSMLRVTLGSGSSITLRGLMFEAGQKHLVH